MNPSVSPLPMSAPPGGAFRRRLPAAGGALGVAWNLFGVAQWWKSLGAGADALMAGGLSRAQAELYLGLPAWMDVVFGVGVFAGLAGSAALLLRSRYAVPALGLSLFAYAVLFAGDALLGVFLVMPRQLAILSFVVGVAIGLLAVARLARASGAPR